MAAIEDVKRLAQRVGLDHRVLAFDRDAGRMAPEHASRPTSAIADAHPLSA